MSDLKVESLRKPTIATIWILLAESLITMASLLFFGGMLLQTSTLLFSIMMILTAGFSKITAWLGVVMHGLDLLHFLVGLFLPEMGVILMIIAGPL
ncbi:MAG: hypothetical protein FP831_05105 [Anaerolineae bacterium]|nr:hypothetical protein [Anaerolineae bacterium]